MSTVFLSYSREDSQPLAILAEDIRSLGHQPWLDQELTGGQRWWDHILEEIQMCEVFVCAVSPSSLDSRACMAEYQYALDLGKPILPVMVGRNVADSLMPPHLSELHRVDYVSGDKAAFASLNRALTALPEPSPLPNPLPEPPPVPASYLYDLKIEIGAAGVMAPDMQAEVVQELRARLASGHSHADLRALVQQFRRRDDLLVRTEQDLAAFEAGLGTDEPAAPDPAPRSTPLAAPPTQQSVPQPAPNVSQPPAAERAQGEVSLAWWLAPVLVGLVGGVVAYFAVRGTNSDTARNMLIAGAVMSVVWAFVFA